MQKLQLRWVLAILAILLVATALVLVPLAFHSSLTAFMYGV